VRLFLVCVLSQYIIYRSTGQRRAQAVMALHDIRSLQSFLALDNHSVIAPPPCIARTRLQYDCKIIAQHRTPPDPPFACHTPYNIGDGNVV